jgi:hypothetical protein
MIHAARWDNPVNRHRINAKIREITALIVACGAEPVSGRIRET